MRSLSTGARLAGALGIRIAFAQKAGEQVPERAAREEEIAREADRRQEEPGRPFQGNGQQSPSDKEEEGSGEQAQAPGVRASRAAGRGFIHVGRLRLGREGSPEKGLKKI